MSSPFILSQGAGQKLEFAIDRNGGNTDDVDWLSAGENFKSVILLARGQAEIKLIVQPEPVPVPGVPFRFQPWKTIQLGLYQTPAAYRAALQAGGFQIGTYADQILDKITISPEVVSITISKPFSVRDLGFTEATRYDAICKRIIELGGQLCPDEVGPATRLKYPDQPKGEWFRTAMQALAVSDGDLLVFRIAHDDDGQWLGSSYGYPRTLSYPDLQFVCVIPRK